MDDDVQQQDPQQTDQPQNASPGPNFNLLQQLPVTQNIQQLSSSQGGGGIASLLNGFADFVSGVHGAMKGSVPTNAPQNDYAQRALGKGDPLDTSSRISQLVNNQFHPNLNGMNPDLMSKVTNVMADLKSQGFDPMIASGMRTEAEQAEKVRLGYSRTMHSNHMDGNAVDIVDSRYQWDTKNHQKDIAAYSQALDKTASKYGLMTGSQWKSFGPYGDFAHVQIPKGYDSNTANQIAQSGSNDSPHLQATLAGIAGVESPGEKNPYGLQSIRSRNGDRAYGKYQIMGSNIPNWTKAATGTAMTPQQFLSNPQAQEKTAAYMVNQNLKAGYSPQDAASIWFSGRPMKQAGNARDAYGTSVPQYVNSFNKGYNSFNPQAVAAKGLTPEAKNNIDVFGNKATINNEVKRTQGFNPNETSRMPSIDGLQDPGLSGKIAMAMNSRTTPIQPQLPDPSIPIRALTPDQINEIMKTQQLFEATG